MVRNLILTVTRACDLRCSYCPTAKDGWPSLSSADALAALDIFESRFGGGDVKLFGGEPLLLPEVVRAVVVDAQRRPGVRRVWLSTNGLGLDGEWLRLLGDHDKTAVLLSLDGRPEDHRRHRGQAASARTADCYDHLMALLPELVSAPRLIVTQTIAPDAASSAADNFAHLIALGFRRFNLLPCYYLLWSDAELAALRRGLGAIASSIKALWRRGERLYVKNLFTWAPTPLFNSGLVVDADRTLHASNVGLASAFEQLLDATRIGSLDDPPSAEALDETLASLRPRIEAALPPEVWRATLAVDEELTRFCRGLYPDFADQRRKRRDVA